MDAAEWLLAGHVVHQYEAHGAPVVGGGDGAVPLLPRRVLQQWCELCVTYCSLERIIYVPGLYVFLLNMAKTQ